MERTNVKVEVLIWHNWKKEKNVSAKCAYLIPMVFFYDFQGGKKEEEEEEKES